MQQCHSGWVSDEIHFAKNHNRRIVPIVVDGTTLPLPLSSTQAIHVQSGDLPDPAALPGRDETGAALGEIEQQETDAPAETAGGWSESASAETLAKDVTCLAFTPDGTHLVAAGPGGDVGIWSVESGQLLERKVMYASGKATGIAVTPDGTRGAVTFGSGPVRMFRLPGLGSKKLKKPPAGHGASLAVDFSRGR